MKGDRGKMAVKDAKLFHIESDIKKIQLKSNMYIRSYGPAGAKHLAQEVIQNAFDEAQDPDATGHDVKIKMDTLTDTLICEDNSRGFNEADYPMEVFCTTLQSGSKFFREDGGNTAGEYGVGLSVVNALSDEFSIESFREDEQTVHKITFENGEKVKDKMGKVSKNGKHHGTIVTFRPSKKYLGEDTILPVEDLINWIDTLFYLDSAALKKYGIKCTVEVYNGIELKEKIKFKPQPFVKLLDKVSDKADCTPSIYLSGDRTVEVMANSLNIVDGEPTLEKKLMNKNIHMDVALRYEINGIHQIWDTYCNDTNTTENGTHKDVVEQVYCRYIQNAVNKSMSEAEKKRLTVTWDDIREGLVCVINLSTNVEVGFIGNEKQKIQCPSIADHMSEIIKTSMDTVFENGDSPLLKGIIKLVKLNAKARLEANKTKNATKVAAVDNFKSHQMKNYIPCNNTGKQFKELCNEWLPA